MRQSENDRGTQRESDKETDRLERERDRSLSGVEINRDAPAGEYLTVHIIVVALQKTKALGLQHCTAALYTLTGVFVWHCIR